ncbi:MAG: hypothetical protein Tsb007_39670 [Rhizobacter sp.]
MYPCNSYLTGSEKLASFLASFFALSEDDRTRCSVDFREKFIEAAGLTASHADMLLARREWADESYVHANGFARLIAFVTSCRGFRLRVHVWPQGNRVDNLNVHNHRYAFASYVERGTVEDVVWCPAENGDVFRRFTYTSRDGSGNYRHEYTGEQALRVDTVRRVHAGQLYSLSEESFHYTLPAPSSVTVTFFAEDRRQLRPSAVTYSRHHAVDEVDTFTPSLSHDVYQQILREHVCGAAVPSGFLL